MSDDLRRERGRVRWYKAEKGYGRITSDVFNDVLFVHFSSIVQDGEFRELREGQAVEFTRTIQAGPHGERSVAIDVVSVSQGPLPDLETLRQIMNHAIHRVMRFSVVGPYTLTVRFTDGTEQRIDFKPVLRGVLFGPLQELAMFEAVALDPEAGTLVWPNGADFDPATLHDWPQQAHELAARAVHWDNPESNQQRADRKMEPTRR